MLLIINSGIAYTLLHKIHLLMISVIVYTLSYKIHLIIISGIAHTLLHYGAIIWVAYQWFCMERFINILQIAKTSVAACKVRSNK